MWWKYPYFDSRNTGKEFQFYGAQYYTRLQTVLDGQTVNAEKEQIIISRIRCKKNESLSQAGNDETENIQKHTCKTKWDALQSKDTL